jgi:hypothetical protein
MKILLFSEYSSSPGEVVPPEVREEFLNRGDCNLFEGGFEDFWKWIKEYEKIAKDWENYTERASSKVSYFHKVSDNLRKFINDQLGK